MYKKLQKFLISIIPIKSIRRNLKNKYFPKNNLEPIFKITENTKCLMVAPHPDDEILGAGGLILKYKNNFDVLCIASAGVKYGELSAEDRANIRISEYNEIMDYIGIKNHWIFKTFGIPPMMDQIEKYFNDYLSVIDTKNYDYIFLPNPLDNHQEHMYITNNIFKRILKKQGFKKGLKIVFYEVWSLMSQPNYYEDISDFMDEKEKVLSKYKSCHVWINYSKKVRGLNYYRGMLYNNIDYAEAFQIISVKRYLNKNKGSL